MVSGVDAAMGTEEDKEAKEDKEYLKEEMKEEKEVKMDLIEIREDKKGGRNSVRCVSYRRTVDFSE